MCSAILSVFGCCVGFDNFIVFAIVVMYVSGVSMLVGVEYIDNDLGARGWPE